MTLSEPRHWPDEKFLVETKLKLVLVSFYSRHIAGD